jgi:hypothetical protein
MAENIRLGSDGEKYGLGLGFLDFGVGDIFEVCSQGGQRAYLWGQLKHF